MTPKTPGKKTIYVDVDEEITGIIDKVRTSGEPIVALVLPKRATMLQSVVNMKLLKRAADQDSKKVVLITSESTLLPIAGAAGLHVAANLQSRPYIPGNTVPVKDNTKPDSEMEDVEIDPKTPIGKAAGLAAADDKPVEIDNTPKAEAAPAAAAGKKAKSGKGKFKVPNFNSFRKKLLLGGAALLLLVIFLLWANLAAPKAKITLKGDTTQVPLSLEFTADTEADEPNLDEKTLPGRLELLNKTDSEKTAATGQKDKGSKAGGVVTLKNCSDNKVTIPAGTGISSGTFTFILQQTVKLGEGNFDSGGNCKSSGGHTDSVNVVAQNNGEQYNLSSRSYTVAGFSGVTAQGGQMSGGTSQVVKVVTAEDIEQAKQKIIAKQSNNKDELKEKLEKDDYIAILESFAEKEPKFKPSAAAGSEATEVTVSYEADFTMLGVKEKDLKELVKAEAKKQIDTSKQAILSDGLGEATFQVASQKETTAALTLNTQVVAGPEVDQEAIKQEIAGKKRGEAEKLLGEKTGIKEARVDLSPFWVYSVPKKLTKITITVESSDGKQITP